MFLHVWSERILISLEPLYLSLNYRISPCVMSILLAVLAMVELDEVAEGVQEHLDHPGTVLN